MTTYRGHATAGHRYCDTGERVSDNPWRACGHCNRENTPEGHDPCLGTLPGVMNACCGHGDTADAYVQFVNGVVVRGFALDSQE